MTELRYIQTLVTVECTCGLAEIAWARQYVMRKESLMRDRRDDPDR
jgi:hypothetical protein